MLKIKLSLLQEQMELKLKQIHVEHDHRGNRGYNSESVLREFIREFMPPSYRIAMEK